MLRLIAVRHAKSSWGEPGLDDFHRPLNKRGIQDAPRMGRWLFENSEGPDAVLSSSSVRTRETYDRMASSFKALPECEFRDDLYLAEEAAILSCLRAKPADKNCLMLIAHNPGLHEAILKLLTPDFCAESGTLRARYPTCAIAILSFPLNSWADLDWSTGSLDAYMEPKQLAASG